MRYTISHIAGIVQGELLHKGSEATISFLLTDSRRLIYPEQTLFFALSGPRRDGHRFIASLYTQGVRNFIISTSIDTALFPEANLIQVSDTLVALQQLAAWHRQQFNLPVTGITGSNGKTIVKDWLFQLLEERYRIVRSPKSYNSQTGVPLSVWQTEAEHDFALFEAGISLPGEMSRLEAVIQPGIGIFTNLGEAHSEGFTSQGQKLEEKLQLFRHYTHTLIYCKDNPLVEQGIQELAKQRAAEGRPLDCFSWSMQQPATLQVKDVIKNSGHTTLTAVYQAQTLQIRIPFTDEASIENAIHCWCLLCWLQLPASYTQEQMEQLTRVAMRLELKQGINNCSIINDSYSADLSSLRIALDFLAKQQQHTKKTVILSDILQSGKTEEELYSAVTHDLEQKHIHRFIGIGERLTYHQALIRNGEMECIFFPSVDAFKKSMAQLNFRDETILLKGARVFAFEEISHLLEQKIHQTVVEINLNALIHNLRQYQQQLLPATRIMAMVKAFSYGSGSYEIANILQFHKVDYLAVAYTDEGVALRKAGISLPVMIMNPDDTDWDVLVQYNLEPDLYDPEQLVSFARYLKKEGIRQFPVHIEVETGMNRLGFNEAQLPQLLEQVLLPELRVQSVFSHLAASEAPEHDAFSQQQFDRFMVYCKALQQVLPYSFIRHIANSAGITRHPGFQLDMVRLGIGLYGIGESGNQLALQEVSVLKSAIAQIRTLKPGETVGYGRTGVATRETRIATVRIGYADGYPRSLSKGKGKMWVNGHLAPVSGMICMDMTMIDITGIPGVEEGDEVVVFGGPLPVTQVAEWAGTIPYEILTGISQRVRRVYFEE